MRRSRMRGGAQAVFPAAVENASYESSLSSPSKMMLQQGNEYQSIHTGQHGGAVAVNLAPAPPGFTGVLDSGLRAQAFIGPLDQSMQAIQGMSDQAGGRRRRKGRKGRKGTRRAKGGATGAYGTRTPATGTRIPAASVAMGSPMQLKNMRNNSRKNNSRNMRTPTRIAAASLAMGSPMQLKNMKPSTARNNSKNMRAPGIRTPVISSAARRQGGGAAYSISHAQDFGAPGMLLSPGQEARALESMNPEWKLATDPTSFTPR